MPFVQKIPSAIFTRSISVFFLILFVTSFVVSQFAISASAAPLSPPERKAVNLYPNWVSYLCGDDSRGLSGQPGNGLPTGAIFPNLDPAAMAAAIDAFVQRENPNSKLNGLGSTIVASSEQANVNPFLIVAIAYMESGLANPSDYNVANGNNSFGRTATTTQPNFQGARLWYKWSSVKASVDSSAPENQNIPGGGDMATYLRKQFGTQLDSGSLEQVFSLYDPGNAATYADAVRSWVGAMAAGAGAVGEEGAAAIASIAERCCASTGSSAPGSTVEGENHKATIWNFLVGEMQFSSIQAAGIMGNIEQESGFDPTAVNPTSGAYGIVQWYAGRETALENFANSKGKSKSDITLQLEFLRSELEGAYREAVLNPIKNSNDLEEVTRIWLEKFEVPCIPGSSACDAEMAIRLPNARRILREFGDEAVVASASTGCPSSSGAAGVAVVVDGYAWPVDIRKQEIDSGYPWPCRGDCHHDDTPAFDLSTERAVGGDDADVVGRDIFAITDGTIENLHVYNGIDGCYSFHLKSSEDGFDYYYTHTRNPAVRNGQTVRVGDKVAEVGERRCTGNGSYPHLHIDRGSPRGAMGGSECCRDDGLVPIMNRLYENLP